MTSPALTRHYLVRGLWDDACVGHALPTATARWPHRTALVLGPDRLTFTRLSARVEAMAARLRTAGVGTGEHVVVQLPNTVELVVTVLAAWHVGAVPVPVLAMYRERELRHVLAATGPAAVVVAGSHGDRRPAGEIAGLLGELGQAPALRVVLGDGPAGWEPFPSETRDPTEPATSSPDDCALVLFTSGTTSAPKGVRHSSRSLFAEARTYRDGAQLSAADAVLLPSPVPHIGALVAAALLPSVTGGRTVVLPRWDADTAAEAGDAEGVTLAVGAPVFLAELLDRYEHWTATGRTGHRITRFHTGAAPTGSTIIRRADAMGIVAWRAWGMTECPTVTYGGPDDPLELRESRDGRIEVGTEVRAFDGSGAPLPDGTPGELRLRSPKLMLGYLGGPPGTGLAPGIDSDGWFTTGDVGVVHPDGWVTIQGRLKDVINRGGEKFAAGEIESVICSHPDIDSAAVLGVPDPRLGERVAAFVTVRAGHDWPGPDALVAYLDGQRLARQKLPVEWRVLAELPRTPTGKIRKNELLAGWDG